MGKAFLFGKSSYKFLYKLELVKGAWITSALCITRPMRFWLCSQRRWRFIMLELQLQKLSDRNTSTRSSFSIVSSIDLYFQLCATVKKHRVTVKEHLMLTQVSKWVALKFSSRLPSISTTIIQKTTVIKILYILHINTGLCSNHYKHLLNLYIK